ncbi:hypothetical protein Pmani_029910 [Petrolisthes manimaculis]|uniref:Uncharacterized protein n=1 Tax=Petrolisthes manimaculis TaxID=1843537 RepID=A0AAE1NYK7_9EUCA|nr:hypothetical protein Pmani_029910 [Petrolisthes manimaculis]
MDKLGSWRTLTETGELHPVREADRQADGLSMGSNEVEDETEVECVGKRKGRSQEAKLLRVKQVEEYV